MTTTARAAARLLVSPGWLLSAPAAARLHHQLERGVGPALAAHPRWLPPGASAPAWAERYGMTPLDPLRPTGSRTVLGAVLVAGGVGTRFDGDAVVVDVDVLVDPGVPVHAPGAAGGELAPADPASAPPFGWRPVIAFVASQPLPGHVARWAATVVDELVDEDTEPRLLVAELPAAVPTAVRPCLVGEASFRTLRPDVVIELDDGAARAWPGWRNGRRAVAGVRFEEALGEVELVSWRIGRAQGATRARIGLGSKASDLASLARRLAAGPHPFPPEAEAEADRGRTAPVDLRTRPQAEILPGRAASSSGRAQQILVLHGDVDALAMARLEGLRVAVGPPAELAPLPVDLAAGDARQAEVLILRGGAPDDLVELVQERRAAGRATIVDLGPDDAVGDGAMRPLLVAAAAAISPSLSVCRQLRALGLRAAVVPTLRPGTSQATTAGPPVPAVPPVLVWRADHRGAAAPAVVAAVTAALGDLSGEHTFTVVPDGWEEAELPPALAASGGPVPDSQPSGTAARYLQLWTPDPGWVDRAGDAGPLVDAARAGMPTVVEAAVAEIVGVRSAAAEVADPTDAAAWRRTIGTLLHAPTRNQVAAAAAARVEDLHGEDALASAGARLRGWAARLGAR